MDERWRPSVTVAAVIEDGGRFLLVEEHTPEGLRLNNPAGHLEPGETPQQAVVREALEETGRAFEPEALLGVYLARFVREGGAGTAAGEDITYLRFAFRGRVGEPLPGRVLDGTIVRTVWMTRDEIAHQSVRHRSPLVMRCIDDHLAGRAYPLELVHGHASVQQPFVLRRSDSPTLPQPTIEAMADEVNPTTTLEPASAAPAAVSAAEPAAEGAAAPATDQAADQAADQAEAAPPAAAAGPAPQAPRAPKPARPEPSLAETAAGLAERFPALFAPGAPRPIKLRIQADIQERAPGAFTKKQLSIFLHRHTTSTAYIRALIELAQRFDLDGQPAGDVAPEHLEAAKVELERRREIVQQRRAAARAAPRDAGPQPPSPGGVPRSDAANEAQLQPREPRRSSGPPDRPAGDRGARPQRHGAHDRRPAGGRPGPGRPERARAGAPGGAGSSQVPRRDRPPQAPRPAQPPHPARPPRSAETSAEIPSDTAAAWPADPARRERAMLLRSFEGSPLTAANFCALTGLPLAEFEAQIALARQERAEHRAADPSARRPS